MVIFSCILSSLRLWLPSNTISVMNGFSRTTNVTATPPATRSASICTSSKNPIS